MDGAVATFRHADGREMAVMADGRILRRRAGGKRFSVINRVTNGQASAVSLAKKIAAAHGYREVK